MVEGLGKYIFKIFSNLKKRTLNGLINILDQNLFIKNAIWQCIESVFIHESSMINLYSSCDHISLVLFKSMLIQNIKNILKTIDNKI